MIIRQNIDFGTAKLGDLQGRPDIGDRVEVGAGAVLIWRIAIGPDTIIGANAVVTKSVQPGVVGGGEPAHILRNRGIRLADA